MRIAAIVAFLIGLLLAVRVMFFGVQRRLDETRLAHRRWPLALGAFLVVGGGALYVAVSDTDSVTAGALALVLLLGTGAGLGAWWLVQRSAAMPSLDPEDDPRYRFQGHVARITEPIGNGGAGRVAFDFEGRRHDLRALWAVEDTSRPGSGARGNEVVIERVEDDVAYVEPWATVEERL
jgi:hypothetical protein